MVRDGRCRQHHDDGRVLFPAKRPSRACFDLGDSVVAALSVLLAPARPSLWSLFAASTLNAAAAWFTHRACMGW